MAVPDSFQPDPEFDPVDELLADCLRHSTRELQVQSLDRSCEEYPEHAQDLRARYAALLALGLEGIASSNEDFALPDGPAGTHDAGTQFGEYELYEVIGQGGMGVVHRARQASLDRDVVVKLIRPELLHFSGSRKRLRREADAIARLQHPGIVPILSAGEFGGVPFFAMEFVEGQALDHILGHLRGRNPGELVAGNLAVAFSKNTYQEAVLTIGRQLAEALHHAHQRGVLHRDVKPSNVILSEEGQTCLIDFGLHALQEPEGISGDGEGAASRLTQEGSAPGTLLYMAPEQLEEGIYDVRSEVYALAATLYELFTLCPPFRGDNRSSTERLIREGRLTPARRWNRGLSTDVEAVLNRALAVDPVRRYVDMRAFADDLQRLLDRRPVSARPDSAGYRMRRWAGRQPGLASALLVLLVGSIAIPAVWIQRQRSHNQDLTLALDREREARAGAEDLSEYVIEVLESADPNLNAPTEAVQQILERGVARLDARLANRPLHRAEVRRVLARIHSNLGLWERGISLAHQSLDTFLEELAQSSQDGQSPEQSDLILDQVIQSRTVLALLLEMRDRVCESLAHRYKLDAEIGTLLPADSWQVLHARANWMRSAQQCPDGLPDGVAAPTHEEYVSALRSLVQVMESEERSPQSLEFRAAAFGWLGSMLIQEAQVPLAHQAKETLEEGKRLLEQSVGEYEAAVLSDSLDCAKARVSLGLARKMGGDLDGAAQSYGRAIETFERRLPPNHHLLGGTLVNSAGLHEARGNHQQAIENLVQAEQIFTESLSADNPNTVVTSGNLVGTRYRAGQTEGLLPKLDALIPRQIQVFGRSHPFVATSLEYRSILRSKSGDLRGAVEDCEQSALIFTETMGENHPRSRATAKLLSDLKEQLEAQ